MAALFRLKANTPKDFEHWKVPVGRVMGELYDRLLEPLFKEHPDLTPPEIGGPPTKAKKVRRRPTKSK